MPAVPLSTEERIKITSLLDAQNQNNQELIKIAYYFVALASGIRPDCVRDFFKLPHPDKDISQ
jgi:hypothetical protein